MAINPAGPAPLDGPNRPPSGGRFSALTRRVSLYSPIVRRVRVIGILLPVVLTLLSAPAALAQADREAKLKAAIVFKLARYVAWPEAAFSYAPGALQICIAGDPLMFEAMSEAQGREVDKRRVEVRFVAAVADTVGCNMLYVGDGASDHLDELLTSLSGNPVVSVSEILDFANGAGIIELVRRDRRFGFRINLDNARNTGVEVSAQLLQLAEVIASSARNSTVGDGRT
jgi:hypothetical protein